MANKLYSISRFASTNAKFCMSVQEDIQQTTKVQLQGRCDDGRRAEGGCDKGGRDDGNQDIGGRDNVCWDNGGLWDDGAWVEYVKAAADVTAVAANTEAADVRAVAKGIAAMDITMAVHKTTAMSVLPQSW
jgi:hypothetical protein